MRIMLASAVKTEFCLLEKKIWKLVLMLFAERFGLARAFKPRTEKNIYWKEKLVRELTDRIKQFF